MAETKEASNKGEARAGRKVIRGVVVSDKAPKTRVVDVVRRVPHNFYEKIITKRSRFYAHDEKNESHEGDLVEIMSTRPLSRLKRWRVIRVLKAAQRLSAENKAVAGTAPRADSEAAK